MIIAEIGNNHEGSYALAEEMIGLAADAGATAVKFQTIVPERLVSLRHRDRIRQLERFRLSYEEFERLSIFAQLQSVLFLSTPFDIVSARFLNSIVPAFKIASGDNNFFPLIEVIAKTGKPIIFSSGLADTSGICKTKDFVENIWHEASIQQELAILHCVTSYPAPLWDANLLAIRELQKLDVTVGYSDHTLGIEAAVLAVALGARIIEKHFTISKQYSDFRDHQVSADPAELAQLVQRVNEAVDMLGDGRVHVQESEKGNFKNARRSIVAARDLSAGTVLTWNDISWVRPGGGLNPGNESELIGKTLVTSIRSGVMIHLENVRTKQEF